MAVSKKKISLLAPKKNTSYSGKYPTRIKMVSGSKGKFFVTLNNNEQHEIKASDFDGKLPRPGDEFTKKNPSPKRIGVKGLKNFIVQIRASKSDDWWTDEVFTDRDEALRFAGKMHKEAPGMHIRIMMDKG